MPVPAGSGKVVGQEFVPHGIATGSGDAQIFETPEALAKHLGVTELPEAVLGISNSIAMVDLGGQAKAEEAPAPVTTPSVIPVAGDGQVIRRRRRRSAVPAVDAPPPAPRDPQIVDRQAVEEQDDVIQAPQHQVFVSLDSPVTMGVGFGTMRVAFHDVIVTDDLIVLRYDQRHTTSVQWMPPGELQAPVGLRLRLASEGPDAEVYHVVSGGLVFEEDGYMAVAVLLRIAEDLDQDDEAGVGTLVSGLPPEI